MLLAIQTLDTDLSIFIFLVAFVIAAAVLLVSRGREWLAWAVLLVAFVLLWNAIAAS